MVTASGALSASNPASSLETWILAFAGMRGSYCDGWCQLDAIPNRTGSNAVPGG